MLLDTIHSKFLIHWTGKDFEISEKTKKINDEIRKKYIERLKSICLKGFLMNRGVEKIWGANNSWVEVNISRTCFTEVRLSQTQENAKRFGELGIGVHRDFVIEREGNPVFYVQNGDKGAVVENIDFLRGFILKHSQAGGKAIQMFEMILGYLKNMSDCNDLELKYYEEMEWRIVYSDRLVGKYIMEEDKKEHRHRLILKPEDVRIIIFPDYQTMEIAFEDNFIKDFFRDHLPTLTTLEDCKDF